MSNLIVFKNHIDLILENFRICWNFIYTCNKITILQIQIPHQNWNGYLSNKYELSAYDLINSNSQEIGIKFTIIDCSNFDKRCSGTHFVSFLVYYYCKQ